MADRLWTIDALAAAAGGRVDGESAVGVGICGISIDSRTLVAGELFVALQDQRDGHDFVPAAFAKGATAALVREGYARVPGDGLLIRVDDVLAALERIGVAARGRLSRAARVIAVTGSAGKTTTKEMLRAMLEPLAPGHVHASDKSFNNHWGVPLTLARMPADTRFAVFEIGMNHAGEITPLTQMVRPHVAIVTTVEAAHLAAFASVEEIARAKAEIMTGLEPGGVAVLNRDNAHYALLRGAAVERAGVGVLSFGTGAVPAGDGAGSMTLGVMDAQDGVTLVTAAVGHVGAARALHFSLGASGRHMALNALAALAAAGACDIDPETAASGLSAFGVPRGRGSRERLMLKGGPLLLIDESYNANPASMRAALLTLGGLSRTEYPRRIAVLGDMLELGDQAQALHEGLAEAIAEAGIDLVFAAGPMMKHLFERLPDDRRGGWAETSAGLETVLGSTLRTGDAVMIKGSNGSRMGPLVEMVRALGMKAA